jgi:CubicO group peptidase (beta-lactamase class C family)
VYSDVGFVLLAWALESITGKKYGDVIRESIIEPLNLTGTYTSPPPESVGVIPGDRHATGWTLDMNQEVGYVWNSALICDHGNYPPSHGR